MTITAKFNGRCKRCGAFLPAGSQIEWSKGTGATCSGGCGKHSGAKRAPSTPTKAGICEVPDGGAVLTTLRYGKCDCATEIGRSFRAGQHAGAVAGQVVTVVGCSRYYESNEFNEDAGDMQGGGWARVVYVRPATEEEATKVVAQEFDAQTKREAAARAKAEAEAAELAQWDALRAHREGLVCLDGYGWELVSERGETVATAQRTRGGSVMDYASLRRVTLCDGTAALSESVSIGHGDDCRDHLYVDAATSERVFAAVRFSLGTTIEKAREYLEKYSECYGAGYYQWVAAQ
jgi:hypothetical protein